MAETDKVFAGSIPVLYDRHLGPLLFEPYAIDMAERAARLAPKRILEIEARRVLAPGGHYLFSVWDRIEENEVSNVVSQAVASLFPQDPPGFLARTPHGDHDLAAIADALKRCGFSSVRSETLEKRGRASSPRDPAIGFCQGSPLRNEIEARDKSRLGEATDAAAEAVARRFGRGPIDGGLRAHVIEAVH
jgi:hypothetical protein